MYSLTTKLASFLTELVICYISTCDMWCAELQVEVWGGSAISTV